MVQACEALPGFAAVPRRKGKRFMHRFFVNPEQINSGEVVITGDDVQHISRVLRLKPRDKISVCDGCGTDYICSVSEVGRSAVTAGILESFANKTESNLNITLYQGLPKGDKLELIIQKCVELGVNRIVPVVTKRTVVKVKNISAKTERLRRIALEAAKQSGRGIVPKVEEPLGFEAALEEMAQSGSLCILPYENERNLSLKTVLRANGSFDKISLMIGPEGGFDDGEAELARSKKIYTVTLGPRILRCETAPVAAVAAVMYELGDWHTHSLTEGNL